MYFAELSNLSVIFMPSEVLAIVSVISKKFHFFSNVLKFEKEKLSFIIPDKIPLYWKGKVILYFTYPESNVLKASVTQRIFFHISAIINRQHIHYSPPSLYFM